MGAEVLWRWARGWLGAYGGGEVPWGWVGAYGMERCYGAGLGPMGWRGAVGLGWGLWCRRGAVGLGWGPRVKGGGAVGLGTHGVSVWAGALGGPGFKVGSTVSRGCAFGGGGGGGSLTASLRLPKVCAWPAMAALEGMRSCSCCHHQHCKRRRAGWVLQPRGRRGGSLRWLSCGAAVLCAARGVGDV